MKGRQHTTFSLGNGEGFAFTGIWASESEPPSQCFRPEGYSRMLFKTLKFWGLVSLVSMVIIAGLSKAKVNQVVKSIFWNPRNSGQGSRSRLYLLLGAGAAGKKVRSRSRRR